MLISMSNFSGDADRSRQLAEAEKNHSCAVNETQKVAAEGIVKPTIQAAFYQDAAKVFKQAQEAAPSPARDALWRKAGAMYEEALLAAPARDEAPEAAINGAFAYKQVGEFGKAIGMYDKFISEYGSNERLTALQKGDGKNGPDLKKYQTRLEFLGQAYDALSTTYYGFFNYQRAAETYEKIGANVRFDEGKRKIAAKNAMVLYANMAQREKATANYRTLISLHPTPDEKANADFLVADYDHKQWSESSPDSGSNREARQAAIAALQTFYYTNRNVPAASRYSLVAAYSIFKMKKAVRDPGYPAAATTAIAAWDSFRAHGPSKEGKAEAITAPFSDYGAEAQFALINDKVHAEYDVETGHHKYAGSVQDIIGDGKGKLGKYQADDLRTNVKEGWRKKKEVELAGADQLMVKRYATAVAIARKYNIRNAQVTHAVERLAYFTDIIGDANMRSYVTQTKDLSDPSGMATLPYTDGMYLQARPGMTATPPPAGEGPPAPVAP
jgi:tetratricopeptide (TPR) repeat protein